MAAYAVAIGTGHVVSFTDNAGVPLDALTPSDFGVGRAGTRRVAMVLVQVAPFDVPDQQILHLVVKSPVVQRAGDPINLAMPITKINVFDPSNYAFQPVCEPIPSAGPFPDDTYRFAIRFPTPAPGAFTFFLDVDWGHSESL